MSPAERLRIWKRELKRLDINARQAAELLGLRNKQTAYNWNSGQQAIPPGRLKQLEAMR